MLLRPAIALALLLSGQFLFAGCSSPILQDAVYGTGSAIAQPTTEAETNFSPDGGQQYGVDGTLTKNQVAILKGLAWPQAYDDIKGTFGFPKYRDGIADYYAIRDSSQLAVIEYNGTTATGFRLEDK